MSSDISLKRSRDEDADTIQPDAKMARFEPEVPQLVDDVIKLIFMLLPLRTRLRVISRVSCLYRDFAQPIPGAEVDLSADEWLGMMRHLLPTAYGERADLYDHQALIKSIEARLACYFRPDQLVRIPELHTSSIVASECLIMLVIFSWLEDKQSRLVHIGCVAANYNRSLVSAFEFPLITRLETLTLRWRDAPFRPNYHLISPIVAYPKLQSLAILAGTGATSIDHYDLAHMCARFPNLRSLHLALDCYVDTELRQLTQLTHLEVTGADNGYHRYATAILATTMAMTQLVSLRLRIHLERPLNNLKEIRYHFEHKFTRLRTLDVMDRSGLGITKSESSKPILTVV